MLGRRKWGIAVAVAATVALVASIAQAAAGQLDRSFSRDGKTTTDFNGNYDTGMDVAVQGNDRIIVPGYSGNFMAAARYRPGGALDDTFSGNGRATIEFPGQDYSWAEAMMLDADGRAVIVGGTYIPGSGTEDDWGVARLRRNGTLDDSFGGDGMVVTDFFGSYDYAYGAAPAPGGKIVVVGEAYDGSDYLIAVARYEADGDPDPTFGGGDGQETYTFGGRLPEGAGMDVIVRNNGKILLVIYDYGSDPDFALAQLNENGNVSMGFGNNGLRLTDFKGQRDNARAIDMQGNRLIVGGRARDKHGNARWGLVRYTNDGDLDRSFGRRGRVMTNLYTDSEDELFDLEVQGNGRIVGAGQYAYGGDMTVIRYMPNGGLDGSFSGDGKAFIRFNMASRARGVEIKAGRIVIGGTHNAPPGGTHDFAVAVLQKD